MMSTGHILKEMTKKNINQQQGIASTLQRKELYKSIEQGKITHNNQNQYENEKKDEQKPKKNNNKS